MSSRWDNPTQVIPEPVKGSGSGPVKRGLALELIKLWKEGEPVDALTLLSRHPELKADKTVLLDLAFEEFRLRSRAGQPVDPDAFCDRYPSFKASLRRLIEDHRRLGQTTGPTSDQDSPPLEDLGPNFMGFTLMRELGRGGFAHVYLAKEPALGNRRVVLKVSRQGGKEAETLGRLQHPNIVPVHSVREHDDSGVTVVCMPYLGNATLCDVLDRILVEPALPTRASAILEAIEDKGAPYERPPTSLPRRATLRGKYIDGVVALGAELADALAYIHSQGIFHRDLKPSNVLMTPDGKPMLLDFNLSFDEQIAENRLGGTLPYMSPEQLQVSATGKRAGLSRVAGPSDIFSLGVILFELLGGAHPFGMLPLKLSWHDVRRQLLERHKDGCLALERLNPKIDPVLARLVQRCLAFEPSDRPRSAAELAANLRRTLSWPNRVRHWLKCHPRATATALATVLAVSLSAGWVVAHMDPYSVRALKRGHAEFRHGNYSQAALHFTRSLERDRNAETLLARGRAHLKLSDLESALADFKAAHEMAADGRIKAALAYCLSLEKLHDNAAFYYRKAVDAGFAPAAVYNDLGYSLLASKLDVHRDQAQEALDKAIKLDPGLQAAHHNRARVDLDRARAEPWFVPSTHAINTALQLGPISSELWMDAAKLHWQVAQRRRQQLAAAGQLAAAQADYRSHVESTLECLTQAVAAGEDPISLKNEFFAGLRTDPAFQRLLSQPASPNLPSKSQRLVDPLE